MSKEGKEKLKEITRLENIDYGNDTSSEELKRIEDLKKVKSEIYFNYLAPSELLKMFSLYHLINSSNRDAIYSCKYSQTKHFSLNFTSNSDWEKYPDPTPFEGDTLLDNISYIDYEQVNPLPSNNIFKSYCTLEQKFGKKGLVDQARIVEKIISTLHDGDKEGKSQTNIRGGGEDGEGQDQIELLTIEEELAVLFYSSKLSYSVIQSEREL